MVIFRYYYLRFILAMSTYIFSTILEDFPNSIIMLVEILTCIFLHFNV